MARSGVRKSLSATTRRHAGERRGAHLLEPGAARTSSDVLGTPLLVDEAGEHGGLVAGAVRERVVERGRSDVVGHAVALGVHAQAQVVRRLPA